MPKPSNHNPRRHQPSPNTRPSIPPAPRPAAAAPVATEPSPSVHVTIRRSGLSRKEAWELHVRLTGELGRVRALLSRIDTWEVRQRRPEPQPCHVEPPLALRAAMRKRCTQILTRLRKQKISIWFNSPVDVEGLKLHDYCAIIRSPMDLDTVKENLTAGRYPSHEAFAANIWLTFNNALWYNPTDHKVHKAADNLLASFEGLYKEVVSWFEQECQRLEPPMPLALPPRQPLVPMPPRQPLVPMLVQVAPRMEGRKRPKPKAREPNKREMTKEEKHKIRVEIGNLLEEEMENVLRIVQKRNTDLALMGDVFELDFDEMDVETLWELDRFVVNWKKALGKIQRTDVMNGDAAEVTPVVPIEDDMVLVNVNPHMVVSEIDMPVKRVTEAEMVDEYVDVGDEMPTVNGQSVEIEKDDAQVVSSSSGSGSGSSSSSDSGSRSSGDSDFDEDDAQGVASFSNNRILVN